MSRFEQISEGHPAQITAYPNSTDVSPERASQVEFTSLKALHTWLKQSKVETTEKKSITLFTRGRCEGWRAKRNMTGPMMLIIDVDDSSVTPEECHERLKMMDVAHVLCTTFTHGLRSGQHRYRIFANYLADNWGELELATRQLGALTGIDNVDPYRKATKDVPGSPLDKTSINGQSFYGPAVHPDRKGVYRLLRYLPKEGTDDAEGAWAPIWQEPQPDPERTLPTHTGDVDFDPEEIREALTFLPNFEREDWYRVGMMLHSSGHEDARALWDEWSDGQDCGKYDPDDQDVVWRSFRELEAMKTQDQKPLTMGTLIHDAREEGWVRKPRDKAPAAEDFAEDASERIQILRGLNDRYAFISSMGSAGKVADRSRKDHPLVLLGPRAFVTTHHRPKIFSGDYTRAGLPINLGYGEVWLGTWLGRRTFERVDFLPPGTRERLSDSVLNLWRGWAHEPGPEGCELFLRHVREVICDGNEKHYRWVVAWMAHLVQHPALKAHSAIVLQGAEGIGKGIFGTALLDLCGVHGIHVTQPSQLTGHFNSHMAASLLVFADEVTWGGDRQAAGVLNSMVTDTMTTTTPKGVDSFTSRSFSRLLIASNGTWVVPAGDDARRWMVLRVASHRRRDYPYFDALLDEIDPRRANYRGGLSGLMRFLQGIDLTSGEWPDTREIIDTAALAKQKIESMRGEARWLLTALQRGSFGEALSPGSPWPDDDSKGIWAEDLYQSYLDSAREQGLTHRRVQMMVSDYLREVFGKANALAALGKEVVSRIGDAGSTLRKQRVVDKDTGARKTILYFPDLETARRLFEEKLGSVLEWDDGDEDDPLD